MAFISQKAPAEPSNAVHADGTAETIAYRDSLIGGEDGRPMGQDHDIALSNPGDLQYILVCHQIHFFFFSIIVLMLGSAGSFEIPKYVYMYYLSKFEIVSSTIQHSTTYCWFYFVHFSG